MMKNFEVLAEGDDFAIVLSARYEKIEKREPSTLSNARYTGEYVLSVYHSVDDGDRKLVPYEAQLSADYLDVLKQKITDLRNRTT